MKLILDLDGVLITTPSWRVDEIDADGYSRFDEKCVTHLNKLLEMDSFEIWLSSSRRRMTNIETFNKIFAFRNIITPISGFLPIEEQEKRISRKEEIESFVVGVPVESYLILDDDKSLNGLNSSRKKRWVATAPLIGFDQNALEKTIDLLEF